MASIRIQSWHGQKVESRLIENADIAQMRDSVDALDNKVTTEVTVEQADESYLVIGGGDGRYHVAYGNADDDFRTLQDESRPAGEEKLVTGGQLGVFHSASIVGKPLAVRAAETFIATGELDKTLFWKEE
ncbi:hypothetical protein P3102_07295 [Amycolatopsis sp. QT-25]|uniref:hypothetical protein n=1 Tax=Amycolatopsis sp. QT-25 TaxID=3034022 RepID=UPI0023ED90D5|nr:hypothetical protein [Amycolatopsis sp. QT-25]WET81030.1 hypothetical protein P3102_07295 [Amycolatopsis sp. QT-25]